MSDLILHHYDFSNFAEKVRLALGFKGLAWQSVIIPPIAPKPDLVPLTQYLNDVIEYATMQGILAVAAPASVQAYIDMQRAHR